MDALFLIGRILFGALFVASGLTGHLMSYPQLKGYAASKGIPMPGSAKPRSGRRQAAAWSASRVR